MAVVNLRVTYKTETLSCALQFLKGDLELQTQFGSLFLSPAPTLEHIGLIFADGRTPWMGDQLVARPLPKHRKTQTQNKCIHTPNIHALCGI
jgi:hypothetical protein